MMKEMYAVYKVRYDQEHTLVEKVQVYRVNASGRMANLHEIDRDNLIIAINIFGESFVTMIDKGVKGFVKGPEAKVITTESGEFIRVDEDVVEKDDLGEIAEY